MEKIYMNKTFTHKFVPVFNLERTSIDGNRYYILPDGKTKLKSVTTLLSEKLDKSFLLEWRAKVGEAEAEKISVQAARRGTAVHNIAEKYLLNEDQPYKGQMPINVESFKPLKNALDQHVDNVLGIELPLFSKALKCAGTTDLVAQYDGVTSIIDFKTSKKLKNAEWIESYFLQSTIYSLMFESLYKIKVPQIVIMITVDHEPEPQIFVRDRGDYVNRVIDLLF
jgi:ATP-dependent exoDNAse (exonuclease V) beta subunit